MDRKSKVKTVSFVIALLFISLLVCGFVVGAEAATQPAPTTPSTEQLTSTSSADGDSEETGGVSQAIKVGASRAWTWTTEKLGFWRTKPEEFWYSWAGFFFTGIFAGGIIFAFAVIEWGFRKIFSGIIERKKLSGGALIFSKSIFSRNPLLWLLLGFAYAMLMMIPILNRALEFITLSIFFQFKGNTPSWNFMIAFLRALILAILIAGIPGIIRYFFKGRAEARAEAAYTQGLTLGRFSKGQTEGAMGK